MPKPKSSKSKNSNDSNKKKDYKLYVVRTYEIDTGVIADSSSWPTDPNDDLSDIPF